MAKGEGPAIGIDLGTVCSRVGVWRKGRVGIIADDRGNTTTPSYVAFNDTDRLVGDAAKEKVDINPTNTVFDMKRLIGRRFSDPSVQSSIKQWPFDVIAGPGDKPMITVYYKGQEKQFTPEEISSVLLVKMKEMAEAHLGCTINKAVVTVPAHFNGSQRQATIDACAMAGLDVLHMINEPTAVAIAYLHSQKTTSSSRTLEKKNVLIFNLGARNLDVSLVTVNGGILMVKATAGATLGGDDFDDRMVDYYIQEFKRRHNKDISRDQQALQRLRKATSELAKRTLSSTMQITIQIDSLYEGMDFYTTLTRGRFNEVNKGLFNKCTETVEKCLSGTMVDTSSVHDIVLAGSSSRMPKVRKLLEDFFDAEAEHIVESAVNPDEATACGHIVESLNPDEAAACGAAVQAAILSGEASLEERCRLVHDVTGLPLGVGTGSSGSVTLLFPWNTTLPAAVRQLNVFTDSENQTDIQLLVYEGEGLMAEDKVLLGEIQLLGFSPGPPGTQITVCFDIDMNGILNVSAEDMKQNKITATCFQKKGPLRKQEIDKMVQEAPAEYQNKLVCNNDVLEEGYVYIYKCTTNQGRQVRQEAHLCQARGRRRRQHCKLTPNLNRLIEDGVRYA